MLITDLNNRERARYAESLQRMAELATECSKEIQGADDDTKLCVLIALLGMSSSFMTGLLAVLKSAVDLNIPDVPPPSTTTKP